MVTATEVATHKVPEPGDFSLLFKEAAELLACSPRQLVFFVYESTFASTSGPAGDIGGNMMTSLPVFYFENSTTGERVKVCEGNWRRDWTSVGEQWGSKRTRKES